MPHPEQIITEKELNDIKDYSISSDKSVLVIDYLGDLYLYKRNNLGGKIYYEYSITVTYD